MSERPRISRLVAKVLGGLRTDECVSQHWHREVAVRERGIAAHGRDLRGRCARHHVVATVATRGNLHRARAVVVARGAHVRCRGTQGLAQESGVRAGGHGKHDDEDGGSRHISVLLKSYSKNQASQLTLEIHGRCEAAPRLSMIAREVSGVPRKIPQRKRRPD